MIIDKGDSVIGKIFLINKDYTVTHFLKEPDPQCWPRSVVTFFFDKMSYFSLSYIQFNNAL